MNRRTFVGSVSITLTAGIAGCVGDSFDFDTDDSPEAAAEAFFQAIADGDSERQEELLHEEATGFSTSSEEFDLTIKEIESQTTEEVVEQEDQSVTEDEIEEIRATIEEQIDEIGATDYAHVYYEIEDEEHGSEEEYLFLVEEDGEWVFYQWGIGPEPERAEATGEETSQEISEEIHIQSATGTVTDDKTIDEIMIIVGKGQESDEIDLETVMYLFFMDGNDSSGTISADQIDAITAVTDDYVITDRADRYELYFEAAAQFGSNLEAGERATVELITEGGGRTSEELKVPDSLVDRENVIL